MANARGKTVDTTSLRLVAHTAIYGEIHRDYLAHCLRYNHVAQYLNRGALHKTAHVLDVGCGIETPLPRLLSSMMMTHTTGSYTGVDYGAIRWPRQLKSFKTTFLEKADFVTVELPRRAFDVVTCFEVLEHVEAPHAFAMLSRMAELMEGSSVAFVSTPCYDPKVGPADNHVNEMSHAGFRVLLEAAGFEVLNVWGTFASQKDYKRQLTEASPELAALFERLQAYYHPCVLACLLAPLFPTFARNCLWQLRSAEPTLPTAAQLKELATPSHGSSVDWPRDLKRIIKEQK